ncbi:MAG: PQQ-binding-like beta-propeller repeat protein [Planctomycetes bacterium]|nr:PQQ-binding-like beta-propeller repeat protein [Planctomycetota bacterium]
MSPFNFLRRWLAHATLPVSIGFCLVDPVAGAQDWLVSRADAGSSGFVAGKLNKEPKLLWEKTFEKSGFEGTPVLSDGKCFAADVEGNVYCLNLTDGSEIWKKSFKNGFVASLALRDGKLILGDYDGHVYCLGAKDGQVLWEADVMQAMASGANFYDDLVLISSEGGVLFAFKLSDGTKAWEYSTGDQLRSAPTIWQQTALLGGCDGRLHKIDLKQGTAQGDGLPLDGPSGSTPAMYASVAIVPTQAGQVLAYDLANSQKKWGFADAERAQEVRSSPAIYSNNNASEKKLAVITTRNRRVLAIDLEDGKMVWEAIVRKRCDASPVICDDRVWVGGLDGKLVALNIADGAEVWSYQLTGQVLASVAIGQGKMIALTDKGNIACFGE